MGYEIARVMPETRMLLTSHAQFETQVWSLARMRKHQNTPCAICKLPVGTMAYRPLTNLNNRSARICQRHGQQKGDSK